MTIPVKKQRPFLAKLAGTATEVEPPFVSPIVFDPPLLLYPHYRHAKAFLSRVEIANELSTEFLPIDPLVGRAPTAIVGDI